MSSAVTILVNNAAITKVHGPWTDIDEAGWDDVMDTNAKGVYLCCRAVHPHMVAAGWGRIINIASVTFLTGQANLAHYVASKGAMIGFTRSLARSVGPEGITVNSVSPGAIQSDVELELTEGPGQREQLAADMARLQSVPDGACLRTSRRRSPSWPATTRHSSPVSCSTSTAAERCIRTVAPTTPLRLPRLGGQGRTMAR